MDNKTFTSILEKFVPYLDFQKFLSFLGLGETLIDKQVHKKVEIAANMGFRGIGVYTNGMLLTKMVSESLMKAGINTLVVSIDGYRRETQGNIRIGSNLDDIIRNVENFISIRNSGYFKARVIIRFTRQSLNIEEWDDFYNFWKIRLNKKYNDSIFCYDVQNFGGNNYISMTENFKVNAKEETLSCDQIMDRIVIFSDGSLGLCCGDQFGNYINGNVLQNDPILLYNKKPFTEYRKLISLGKMNEIRLCRDCSNPISIKKKEWYFL
jgi:hypothetical protein